MHNASTIAADSGARRLVIGAAALTVAVLTGLVGYLYYVQREHAQMLLGDLRIEELAGEIKYLDELLTMSARLCAASGDRVWEERYHRHVDALDRAIKEAAILVPDDSAQVFTAQTDVANQRLVAMEMRSFDLVRSHRKEEAFNLLMSSEYAAQKQIYADGVATLIEAMMQRTSAARRHHDLRSNVAVAASGLATLLLALVWIQVLRSVNQYRAARTLGVEEQKRLLAILEASPDFIGFANPKAEIQYINRAGRAMVGIGATEDIAGLTIPDVHPTWFLNQMQKQMRVGLPQDLWVVEGAFKDRAGAEIPISMVLVAHRGEDGTVTFYSTISRDIRERKRGEEERQKLVALVESSDEFIGIAGLDEKITYLNPAACRLVGLDPGEATSMTLWDFVPPDALEQGRNAIMPTVLSSGAWRGELPFRHFKTGAAIPMELSCFVVKHPQTGKPLCLATVSRDITQRKQAEREVIKQRDFSQMLIESMPGVVYFVNDTAQMVRWNKNAELVSGYSGSEIAGMSALKFYDPADQPRILAKIQQVFETGKGEIEAPLLTRSGRRIPYLFTGMRLLIDDRPHLVGVGIDISERIRAEEKMKALNADLRQHAAELQAALTESEEFAYAAAHNLRSPLRGIDGFCQVVLEDERERLSPEGRQHLERVRRAAHTMAAVVDELLRLSRLSRTKMDRQTTDLSALARWIADGFRQRDPERQVEFVIADGVVAECDGPLARIVLEELLENAWKFTTAHPQARIEFGAVKQTDQTPAFFVRDDGVGFDMAYADKLFVPFQHLHAPGEFEGTGIGLATVQRIVRRHGGQVWAEGQLGHGATFYFTL